MTNEKWKNECTKHFPYVIFHFSFVIYCSSTAVRRRVPERGKGASAAGRATVTQLLTLLND